jgi:hypothetical protein
MTDQRHIYITPGISRETFTEVGVRMTTKDTELDYYIHQHRYDMFDSLPCNHECTVIRLGKVERVVHITQTDDAKSSARG